MQRTSTLERAGTLQRTCTLERAGTLLRATALLLTFLLLSFLLLSFLLLSDLLVLTRRSRSLRIGHTDDGEARRDRKTLRSKCNFNHQPQPDRGGNHQRSHF